MDTDHISGKPVKTSVAELTSPIGISANEAGVSGKSFLLDVAQAGVQEIAISYANGRGEGCSSTLTIDGTQPELVSFPSTGSWTSYATRILHIDMKGGAHVLTFSSLNNSGPDLVSITHLGSTTGKSIASYLTSGALAGLNIAAVGAVALALSPSVQQANEATSAAAEPAAAPSRDVAAEDPPAPQNEPTLVAAAPATDTHKEELNPTTGSTGASKPSDQQDDGGERKFRFLGESDPQSDRVQIGSDFDTDGPAQSAMAFMSEGSDNARASQPGIAAAEEISALAEPEAPAAFAALRIQAENATFGNSGGTVSGPPTVVNTGNASASDLPNAQAADGAAYVDFAGVGSNFNVGSGQYIEWNFTVPEEGYYDLAFGYAFFSSGATNRPLRIDVNGELWDRMFDMRNTGANTTYSEATTRVYLEAGTNVVRLTSNGFSGANIDYLEVRAPDPNVFVFQAEDLVPASTLSTPLTDNRAITPAYLAALNPTLASNDTFRVGAEGESYLDWGAGDASVDFTFNAPAAGKYAIAITYVNGGTTNRPLELVHVASGQQVGGFAFASTNGAKPPSMPTDVADIDPTPGGSGEDANVPALSSGWEGWSTETIIITVTEAGPTTLRLTSLGEQTTGPNIDKIVVSLANAAPTAQSGTGETNEDTSVQINVADLIDDINASDTLTVTATVPGTQGTVSVSGTVISFTPAPNFNGQASIAYTVADQAGNKTSSTVVVTVDPVNDAPEFPSATIEFAIPENAAAGTVVGTVPAADPDQGDSLTYSVNDARFSVNESGQIVVVAGADFDFGAEPSISLTVTAIDAAGLSTSQGVTVTVGLVNGAPQAEDFAADTAEDTAVVINVLDHIDDPDGDTLTVTADVPVEQGSISVNGTEITFSPAPNFNGEATITYTVTDSSNLASSGSIAVTVGAENDAPTINGALDDATVPAEGGSIDLSGLAKVDVDSDATAFGVRAAGGGSLPAGVTLSGTVVLVDASVAPGEYELEIFATDGALESSVIPFTLTKSEPAPAAEPFAPFVLQAEAGVLTVLDADANTNDTVVRDPSNPEASNLNLPNNLRPGFTGTGYVDFGDTAGDKLTLSFAVPVAGTYDIHIRYASNTARPLAFSLDGGSAVNLAFASTDPDGAGTQEGFNNWLIQKTTITVAAGNHTIALAIPAGANTGPNIDAIAITEPGQTASFFVPVFTSGATASFAEDSAGTVLDVNATDGDGATLTYALSGSGSDDALFNIDPVTGALTFKAAPDFEGSGDNAYSVEVAVTDGTSTITQTISVTVTNVNEAPTSVTVNGALTLAEDAAAGTVVGSVSGVDPDAGGTLTLSVNDPRFVVNANGEIVVAVGAEFDFEQEPNISLTVTATDGGGLSKTQTVTLGITNVDEQVGPLNVLFSAAGLTSYSPQDVGTGASVSDEGATLNLAGNLWKRAELGESYTITVNTKLVFTYTIGQSLPEIVAIGFDDDNSPFETADKSVYQIAGAETQSAFVDLRGGVIGAPGTTATITIDLSAHAGKTISSLVFIADDDSPGNGIGSASFTNVQLTETPTEAENAAPVIVGGGIADLVVDERSSVEIDLPFVDPNGDELTYTLTVTDSLGHLVTGFEGLSVQGGGVLAGQINAAPSAVPYVVTVTANDGNGGETTLTFDLTVENVNEAPTLDGGVAYEPYFGRVGTEINGIDLNLFKDAFSDADGDTLTFTVEGLPAGLSLNGEGVIVGTPSQPGTGSFKVIATDPDGLRAELVIQLEIEEAGIGDVTVIEAEDFTGLGSATDFYLAATPGASGNQIIRTDANETGSVSTSLAQNGLTEGWYEVSVTVYDETDGTAFFSLKIGDTLLADNVSFSEGTFDNNLPRGNAGQAGNLKTISFSTPVFVDASTIALLTGRADAGENLRIDKLTFTRVASPELPPSAVTLSPAAIDENVAAGVIGTLSATDPDGEESGLVYSTSDARFTVVGNELRLANGVSLDHEAGETVAVAVTVTDAQGLSTTTNVVVAVGDVNEAPTLAPTAAIADVTLTEGETQAIDLAAALGAADPDAGDAAAYGAALAGGGALPAGITLVGSSLQIGASVPVGTYEIEVFATDGELDSESVSFTVTIEEEGEEPEPLLLTIQAETGTLAVLDTDTNTNDTTIRDPSNPETTINPQLVNGLRPGFTGTGYVDFGDTVGDKVTYSFDVPAAGTYTVSVRYASNGARPLDLSVNGGSVEQLPFIATGSNTQGPTEGFNNWAVQTFTVELQAGSNTLSFAIPAGFTSGPNLDSIEIVGEGAAPDTSADADDQPLFLSGPDGPLSGAAKDSINFQLAGIDSDAVKVELSFNGGATRVEVFPDADGDFTVDGSALSSGGYTVTTYVTDDDGNVATETMDITVGGAVDVPTFTIQAEDATKVTVQDMTGTGPADGNLTRVVSAATPDASGNYRAGGVGGAYMDFGGNAGDAITINVDAPEAGTYLVTFRYGNGGATNRPLDVSVNGGTATSVDFVPGPVVGTPPSGWESWVEKTVEVTLGEGVNTIKLAIPAGAVAGPNIDQITFDFQTGSENPAEPFSVTIEGETFTTFDPEAVDDTVARTAANKEPQANASNSGPGLEFDSAGLRPGYEGTGYMDMGNDIGDSASFTIDAPEAGTYQLTVRYVNGGTTDRPMTLTIGGQTQTLAFNSTAPAGATADVAWQTWGEFTVDIELAAGTNTISFINTIANGPNIDNVTISREGTDPVDTREQIRFEEVVKINFQPPTGQTTQGLPTGYTTPAGYQADTGQAFGDRGNGFSYGWVTEASVADGTANGTVAAAQPANAHWYKNTASDASDLQKTYAHFEYPGAGPSGARAWEMALEDGTYQVTMSVGDTAGAFDSDYVINVEGQNFMPHWVPANEPSDNQNGGGFRSTLVTGVVTVTDGRLTIDSIGGTNTEIQYLEIEKIEDLTPGDGRTADQDYSYFVAPVADTLDGQVSIAIGANGELPVGIDPTSMFVIGVNIQAEGNRGPNITHTENIKLVETLTGIEVEIDVQISGGADSLTIRPVEALKENTSYTLKVEDVMDLGSITDPDAPLRQMQDLTTTFVTGEAPEDVAREVAFSTNVLLNGFADGAGGYTSIEFGPDGKLYVATITGEIHRWNVNPDGTIDKNSQETVALDYLDAGGGERRGIVGFVFDPNDPNTIWITDNAPIPREQKAFDTPDFSGRVSKITLGAGGSLEDATAETYIRGLPRSGADHLSNSLEFRENPNFGALGEPEYMLYMSQGSNSAAGAPDGAWGNRPERLLNAAILEIDPTKAPPAGGFNVQTEPLTNNSPTTQNPASAFNADGTYPGWYNPFAEDAVLKIYATGVRNAYDLVWHSNGHLYVPTNGTASGGKTPNDPTQPGLDTVIANSPKQYDYFFTVDEGGYYGHPNVLRDQYVLNGGNPTSGLDPNEVVGGNDGNSATDGYQVGVDPDPNYDLDGVYNLGYNRSPNGAIEYTGNAFGSNLKGAILFAQFSTGDNVRVIRVDANGNIIGDDVLRRPDGSVINNYIDPLDIIQNPVTGQLYLMTLNRGTGASQLILLTPAPGGVTEDVTANEGGDLALVAFDVSDPSAAVFQINGLDDDITAVRVRFNGGPETTVTLNAQDRFTVDISALTGQVTATIRITDDDLNEATASTNFTPGEEPETPEFVTLVTIQAEDKTSADGTSVTIPTSAAAQIQIRDASNPETGTGVNGPGYVNALRPGAVGLDGNTDNTDGTPGGYADFGSSNADYLTFTFEVPDENAGSAILRFRYANGATLDRPLQLEVNGTIVKVQSFLPTSTGAGVDGWTVWAEVEVPVTLLAGQNTVTLRSTAATGPNIDQMEVLVQQGGETVPNDGEVVIDGVTYVVYEAENAEFTGPAVVTEDRNQSGDGFVDFVGTADQTITWTVAAGEAGSYAIDFLYALATTKAARPMTLTVNGVVIQTLPFAPNSNAAETTWGSQSVTLNLTSGLNTVSITAPNGNGPNVDALRITKEPVEVFEPDYAEISGSGRIELEATDGSAHTVSGSVVEFYFTVNADGVYKLDVAANAGANNGQVLRWFLNGVEIDDSEFPTAGEESIYIDLDAGTEYQIRIISDAPGANGIDYLDIAPAPGDPNADIGVQSLDPAFLDDRLHFSYLENPDAVDPDAPDRDFKDSGTVRLTNTGTAPLTVSDFELDGPFVLQNPDIFNGLTLAAGQSIDVTVLFNRAAYTPPISNVDATSTVFQGQLKIITNDADSPVATIDLAGFWQARDEGGQEPNVNEVWRIFGFGNVIEGLRTTGGGENSTLSTKDVFAKTDVTEELSPYWKIADGYASAKITQIAAFHGTGGATIGIHNPTNKGQGVTFWNHEGTDNQRLLPNVANDTSFATRTFTNSDVPDNWLGSEVFGISVAGLSTDPRLNPSGPEIVPGTQQGHTVKIFQALDADGNVIPNVFLGIMDYTGINYDYNDNLFVIEGIEPVGFGQEITVSGLDDAAADDRLVFTNIDNPANGSQAFRNEATFTITNDGFVALNISGIQVGDASAFQIVGTIPTSIAPGASAQVTVRFIGTHTGTAAGAELFTSTLTILSDDYSEGQKVIQLAGLAQEFSENNSEPTVAQIVEAFGYGTDMAQDELAGGGVVETVGDEVLMPYLQKLDASKPVEVIQIAAFLNQGNVARLGFHQLGSDNVTNLFANDDQQGQTVLPDQLVAGNGAGANVARGTIGQNGPFGLYISVDGRPTYSSWSDPEANKIDPNFGQLVGEDQGHLIRFFQALDADGNVIEGTFIAIQDYPGAGNYDYNDHMFVIKNVKAYDLTVADDADGNGVNDALEDDVDNDGTVDFFDPDNTPENPGNPRGDYVLGVNFGGGAIANDPVLGVALVAQTDPRVVLTGSVNPGAGADAASNPNGANAVAGSAFKTYEDGTDWQAAITVPNGTYVVVIHTQETYWNAAGMRQFDVLVNGQAVINNLDPFAAAGGGDKPLAFEAIVTVTNGKITLNMHADKDNAAINAVTIYEYEAPGSGQEPVNGTPFVVDLDGVTIDATDYDDGGQGVAYNDAPGLQGGTNGGRAGSAVEVTGSGDIGWIESGEWLEYTIDVDQAGAHDLSLLLANGGGAGRTAMVSFYRPGETSPYATSGSIANPQTTSWSTFVSRSNGTVNLEEGEQIVRVTFSGGSQDFRSINLKPVVVQTPFGGTAPGFVSGVLTVDATNFDNGGQGIAYSDNAGLDNGSANSSVRPGRDVEFVGSSLDIGHVKPGEWVEYTINVPTAGVYAFTANAKTPVTGATIAVSLNGATPLGTVTLADGHAGGSNFSNAAFADSAPISLSLGAGVQTLRLTFNGPLASNGYVLDLASFKLTAPAGQTPFNGTAPLVDDDGLTVDALHYDNGGQGVAYNDAAGLEGGTNGGRAGSAVEITSAGDVGWIANGEWLEYTITVEEAGSYDFNLSMALGEGGGPNRSVTATFTNGSAVDTVTVGTPRTGTWSNFQDTDTVSVNLDAGTTVVRLTFNGGSQDFSSFTLEPSQASPMALMSLIDEPPDMTTPEPVVDATAVADLPEGDSAPATDPEINHLHGYDIVT